MNRLAYLWPLFRASLRFNKLLSTAEARMGVATGKDGVLHDRKLLLKNAMNVQMVVDDENQCRELLRSPTAQLLLFHSSKPLLQDVMTSSNGIHWLNLSDILKDTNLSGSWNNISDSCVFLGYDPDDRPLFAAEMTVGGSKDGKSRSEMKEERDRYGKKLGGSFVDLRSAGFVTSPRTFRRLKQAFSLLQWNSNHQYSSISGKKTRQSLSGHSRLCPETDEISYPQISSVAITLVTHKNHCLLARQTRFPPGMYSALAGFCALGESAEDCVEREVAEEVNLSVTNIRYISSQPWPVPSHSLMLGFHATLNTEISPFSDCIDFDCNELEDARWYSKDDVRSAICVAEKGKVLDSVFFVPPPFAIAHQLIKHWVV